MDSILTSVKKSLGITEEYEHFDADILMHINTALMTLTQIGVGPSSGFAISDKSVSWADFLGDDESRLSGVRTYIFLRVKLVFDPPASPSAIESLTKQATELEWRLNADADTDPIDSI